MKEDHQEFERKARNKLGGRCRWQMHVVLDWTLNKNREHPRPLNGKRNTWICCEGRLPQHIWACRTPSLLEWYGDAVVRLSCIEPSVPGSILCHPLMDNHQPLGQCFQMARTFKQSRKDMREVPKSKHIYFNHRHLSSRRWSGAGASHRSQSP